MNKKHIIIIFLSVCLVGGIVFVAFLYSQGKDGVLNFTKTETKKTAKELEAELNQIPVSATTSAERAKEIEKSLIELDKKAIVGTTTTGGKQQVVDKKALDAYNEGLKRKAEEMTRALNQLQ